MKYSKPPKKKLRKLHQRQSKRALWIILLLCGLLGLLILSKVVSWDASRARFTQWFAAHHSTTPPLPAPQPKKSIPKITKPKPVAAEEALHFEFYSTLPGGQEHPAPPRQRVAVIQPDDIEAELLKEKSEDA
jgi:hypothetical protein